MSTTFEVSQCLRRTMYSGKVKFDKSIFELPSFPVGFAEVYFSFKIVAVLFDNFVLFESRFFVLWITLFQGVTPQVFSYAPRACYGGASV